MIVFVYIQIQAPYPVYNLLIFSPILWVVVFRFLIVFFSFEAQKSFIWMKFNLEVFFFCCLCFFAFTLKNPLIAKSINQSIDLHPHFCLGTLQFWLLHLELGSTLMGDELIFAHDVR